MKKHKVILDMSYNKLIFWLDHCQHAGAIKELQEKYIPNPIVEEVQDKSTPISEIVEYPKLLSYVLLEYKSVSKIAIPLKQILKQGPTPVSILLKRKKL